MQYSSIGSAFDVLHDEIRQAVVGRVAVQQVRDVRVIEARKDLPLVAEAAQHGLRIHAALDELDRDLFLVLPVGAPGEIDGAHAAAADALRDFVVADDRSDQPVGLIVLEEPRVERHDRRLDEITCRLVGSQQRIDFPPQGVVACALLAQECVALSPLDAERGMKNRLDGLQPRRLHAQPAPLSSA